jgi:hypothetical protein
MLLAVRLSAVLKKPTRIKSRRVTDMLKDMPVKSAGVGC